MWELILLTVVVLAFDPLALPVEQKTTITTKKVRRWLVCQRLHAYASCYKKISLAAALKSSIFNYKINTPSNKCYRESNVVDGRKITYKSHWGAIRNKQKLHVLGDHSSQVVKQESWWSLKIYIYMQAINLKFNLFRMGLLVLTTKMLKMLRMGKINLVLEKLFAWPWSCVSIKK